MLTFDVFRIPVRVQLFFWLTAFYFSGGFDIKQAGDWFPVLVCMAVIFISILMHEGGHALASRYWGGQPVIELHGLGGVTYLGGWRFSRWQHLAITAAGPVASLLAALICFLLHGFSQQPLRMALEFGVTANVFWTIVNLLPILPMDGGQILRDLIGPRHERVARVIGMVAAIAVGLYFYLHGSYFNTVIMGIFAWLNFQGSIRAGGVQ